MKAPAILALAATAAAVGMKPSPTPDKPDAFRWKYPFTDDAMASWTTSCTATKEFDAKEFTLHDLMDPFPKGLGAWAPGLKEFFAGREYPGGWGGWDRHLHDRTIVYMEYSDVPVKVREWIEREERENGEGKGLFAIFKRPAEGEEVEETVKDGEGESGEKVVIFAPGALYEVLPLWVAEGSECEETLLDLSRYQPEHEEGKVVAWPRKTRPGTKKEISIEITASQLGGRAEGSPVEGGASESEAAAAEESGEKSEEAKAEETGKGKDEL